MVQLMLKRAIYLGVAIVVSCTVVATAVAEETPAVKDLPKEGKLDPQPVPAPVGEIEWQKLETKLVPLSHPKQLISPGYFDVTLQHIVNFPKAIKGKEEVVWVDTGLAHAGRDSNGKEYPALKARLTGDFIWLDANADGKPNGQETVRLNPDGCSNPLTVSLHYEDGSTAPYTFCFKTIVENEKYAVVRCTRRVATFRLKNHDFKLTLSDENGNGLYDELNKDGLQVDDLPLAFLGKYILIGNSFFEVLIHAAGTSIEIRPAPKLETGLVDLLSDYKPSQKGENLQFHAVIISGPEGSFSYNQQHPSGKVPCGAYDLVFALIERGKEVVYVKKGQTTSFNVNSKDIAKLKWGGKISVKFDVSSDGSDVFVNPPSFEGEGTETYYPENPKNMPLTVNIYQAYQDNTEGLRHENFRSFGQRRFESQPDGSLKPAEFKCYRPSNDRYKIEVSFASGIMGTGMGREFFSFVFKRKDTKNLKGTDDAK